MTEQAEEWGPWIRHGRKRECPVPLGTRVQCTMHFRKKGVFSFEGIVSNDRDWRAVLRYRIYRPRALRDLIALANTMPAHIRHCEVCEEHEAAEGGRG